MNEALYRHEALAWLAGRLRWEHLLAELNSRTETKDVPADQPAAPAPTPARRAA